MIEFIFQYGLVNLIKRVEKCVSRPIRCSYKHVLIILIDNVLNLSFYSCYKAALEQDVSIFVLQVDELNTSSYPIERSTIHESSDDPIRRESSNEFQRCGWRAQQLQKALLGKQQKKVACQRESLGPAPARRGRDKCNSSVSIKKDGSRRANGREREWLQQVLVIPIYKQRGKQGASERERDRGDITSRVRMSLCRRF